jgi:hypothetical protein
MIFNQKTLAAAAMAVGLLSFGQAAQPTPDSTAVPVVGGASTGAAGATNSSKARLSLATNLWHFGRAMSGTPLHYSFVFTNTGTDVLEIKSVDTSCGCIPAGEWSKRVEPGKTGAIPLQLRSTTLEGAIDKTVTVACNDPTGERVVLKVQGTIWKPVHIKPVFLIFNVGMNSPPARQVIHITNNMPEPMILSAPESDNRAFTVEIATNKPGKEFRLVVKTVPPLPPGPATAKITVKTSSTNCPILTMTAFAAVPPVFTLTPPELVVPVGPLAGVTPLSIRIRSHLTNAVVLSDASINATNVRVEIKEVTPGRAFRATLTFPKGFKVPPDHPLEFSFKSNDPLCPLVKVPVSERTQPTASILPPPDTNTPAGAPPLR